MDNLSKFLELQSAPVVVALIALFGAIVAAIISYLISRRSIYINSVTAERSKWIGELRSNIANLPGHIKSINRHTVGPIGDIDYEKSHHFHKSSDEIHTLSSLIKLQLNPFGEIDKNILSILENLEKSFLTRAIFDYERTDLLLIAHAQWLLKAEWETVKMEAAGLPLRLWVWIKSELHLRRYRKFANAEGAIK